MEREIGESTMAVMEEKREKERDVVELNRAGEEEEEEEEEEEGEEEESGFGLLRQKRRKRRRNGNWWIEGRRQIF
ncbi:hypothetical protein ACLB2K_023788 [Fragaria x ananassa]